MKDEKKKAGRKPLATDVSVINVKIDRVRHEKLTAKYPGKLSAKIRAFLYELL